MHIIEQLIAGSGAFSPISFVEDDERFDQISQLSAKKLNIAIDRLMILEPFLNDFHYWHCHSLETDTYFLITSNKYFEDLKCLRQTFKQVQENFKILQS